MSKELRRISKTVLMLEMMALREEPVPLLINLELWLLSWMTVLTETEEDWELILTSLRSQLVKDSELLPTLELDKDLEELDKDSEDLEILELDKDSEDLEAPELDKDSEDQEALELDKDLEDQEAPELDKDSEVLDKDLEPDLLELDKDLMWITVLLLLNMEASMPILMEMLETPTASPFKLEKLSTNDKCKLLEYITSFFY